MRVVILAAGEGNRLRPHTENKPKCLVSLGGRSLLERQIEVLQSCGLTDISIVTGYRSESLKSFEYPTFHNKRYDSTNMVFSLMEARRLFDGEDDLLITYGDVVFEPMVIEALLKDPSDFSLAVNAQWKDLWELRMEDPLSDAETLQISNGCITEIGKPAKNYSQVQGQYMGLIKVSQSKARDVVAAYDRIPQETVLDGKDKDNMYMTSFLQHMINDGLAVNAVVVDGGWLEIDTVEDLECYENLLKEGKLDQYCQLMEGSCLD